MNQLLIIIINRIELYFKYQRYITLNNPMEKLPTVAPARRELSSDCNTLELTNGKATSLMGLADN